MSAERERVAGFGRLENGLRQGQPAWRSVAGQVDHAHVVQAA